MKVEIELEKEDILKEISNKYKNDLSFLHDIVYEGTSDWYNYKELIKKMIANLKANDGFFFNELLND